MQNLTYWLVQAVGALVIVLSMVSFQMKRRRNILIIQIIAQLTSCTYFFLSQFVLGESVIVAGCLDLIAAARTAVFYFADRKKWAASPAWLIGFIVLMTATGIYMWQTPWDVLIIVQMILSTVGFRMKKETYIRLLCLGVGICGIVYGLANHTPMSVLTEVMALSSIVLGIIRYDLLKKKSAAPDELKKTATEADQVIEKRDDQ